MGRSHRRTTTGRGARAASGLLLMLAAGRPGVTSGEERAVDGPTGTAPSNPWDQPAHPERRATPESPRPGKRGAARRGERPKGRLTGSWGGRRDSLEAAGLTLSMRALVSASGVWAGGRARGAQALGVLDGGLRLDLEPLVGWEGGMINLRVVGVLGDGPTERVGDDQQADDRAAESAAIPYEAWLQQALGPSSARLGLLALDTEFAVLPATRIFVHSSPRTPAAFAAAGPNGPGIYPISALGGRVDLDIASEWKGRIAVVDGLPGDPERPGEFVPTLRLADGVLVLGELTYTRASNEAVSTRVVVGGYGFTAPRRDFGREDSDNYPFGAYVLAQQDLFRANGRRLTAYLQLDAADGASNLFTLYLGAGLVLFDLFPFAARDALGVALASGWYGDGAQVERGLGLADAEGAFELTYQIEIVDGLVFQPALQHILNPGGETTIGDAWVTYARAEVSL